jgi:hypothetical protein
MKAGEKITDDKGKEYIKLELLQVIQKEQSFYLTKVKASQFIKIYTVRPAEYDFAKHSSLAQSFPEESEYYNHLINEDKEKIAERIFNEMLKMAG